MNLLLRSFLHPRKLNVSSLLFPLLARFSAVKRPNSISRFGYTVRLPTLHGYTEALDVDSLVEPNDDVIGISDHHQITMWHGDLATDAPTDRRRSGITAGTGHKAPYRWTFLGFARWGRTYPEASGYTIKAIPSSYSGFSSRSHKKRQRKRSTSPKSG